MLTTNIQPYLTHVVLDEINQRMIVAFQSVVFNGLQPSEPNENYIQFLTFDTDYLSETYLSPVGRLELEHEAEIWTLHVMDRFLQVKGILLDPTLPTVDGVDAT